MPRGARLDAPGTLHHVMVRGIEGNSIVADDEDQQYFVSRMGKVAQVLLNRSKIWNVIRGAVIRWR